MSLSFSKVVNSPVQKGTFTQISKNVQEHLVMV